MDNTSVSSDPNDSIINITFAGFWVKGLVKFHAIQYYLKPRLYLEKLFSLK